MVQKKPRLAVPAFLEFQHPRLVDAPPSGEAWGHEIKYDGYRVQLRVEKGQARLISRNGNDQTHWLPAAPELGRRLPDCIIDAELCAVGEDGRPSFSRLQRDIGKGEDLVLFAFDLLWLGFEDQRPFALPTRKALLQQLVQEAGRPLIFVQTFTGVSGPAMFANACENGLEGIVSKRLDVGYQAGRGEAWLKTKCRPGQEVVAGGWRTEGSRFIGVLCGVWEEGRFTYAGSVKNGFGHAEWAQIMPRLKALQADRTPFEVGKPTRRAGQQLHWCRPELVIAVQMEQWTDGGHMRQSSYKGMRPDKDAAEVVREG